MMVTIGHLGPFWAFAKKATIVSGLGLGPRHAAPRDSTMGGLGGTQVRPAFGWRDRRSYTKGGGFGI